MSMFTASRAVLALMVVLSTAVASADPGLTFGLSLNPVGPVANASVAVPVLVTGEAQHAARADVSYAFHGLPALSATYLLRDADPEGVRTYVGAGAGVAFLSQPSFQPMVTLHGLVGGTVPVVGGLGAFGEVVVGGNALATNLRLAFGVSYSLGGY